MKLAFYHGRRKGVKPKLIAAAVRWFTRSRFTHVEILFSDGMTGAADLVGGVHLERDKHYDPADWEIVPIVGDEVRARMWFVEHNGAGFDRRGVFGFLWGFDRGHPTRWFCSEAVAAALGLPDPFRFDPTLIYVLANSTFDPRTRKTAELLLDQEATA